MPTYTTKKLAQSFGVSAQTVRNAVKDLKMNPNKPEDSRSFIFTQEQALEIARHLKKKLPQEKEETENAGNVVFDDLISFYKEQIEDLKEQIKIKDEQIANQDKHISALLETNKQLSANATLQTAVENKDLLLAEVKPAEEKKSFWKRLFG